MALIFSVSRSASFICCICVTFPKVTILDQWIWTFRMIIFIRILSRYSEFVVGHTLGMYKAMDKLTNVVSA